MGWCYMYDVAKLVEKRVISKTAVVKLTVDTWIVLVGAHVWLAGSRFWELFDTSTTTCHRYLREHAPFYCTARRRTCTCSEVQIKSSTTQQ